MEVLRPVSLLLAPFMWNIMSLSAWPLRQNEEKRGAALCQMVQRNEDSIRLTDPLLAFWKGVICFNLIVLWLPVIWLLFSPPADLPLPALWQIGLCVSCMQILLDYLIFRDICLCIYISDFMSIIINIRNKPNLDFVNHCPVILYIAFHRSLVKCAN